MKIQSVALGFALGLIGTSFLGQAEAKEIKWKASASGTFVNTEVDTNGDGGKAGLSTFSGKGSLGSFTAQALQEFVFTGECVSPDGNAGVQLEVLPGGPQTFSVRFDSTGDLLHGTVISQTTCIDLTTGIQSFTSTSVLDGGTGRFEGASGGGEATGTGLGTFDDGAGNFFGNFTETFEAKITLP